jgi:L-aminopeptidase/D-esterase-like protein
MKLNNSLTDISGIRVGQVSDLEALTGCTVILCESGAVGGVDQRGGAPGTRETDLLRPMHLVQEVHAILLAGGSAFGLDAAAGVMRYLESRGVGYPTGAVRVPIVPAAILYDLGIGDPHTRPDGEMGYQACLAATSDRPLEGNVGAGTGCTVGKIMGPGRMMKSGLGTASMAIGGGVIVAALMAVNAFGDVIDPHSGAILAGVRASKDPSPQPEDPGTFSDTLDVMRTFIGKTAVNFATRGNTTIGVVATNARLDKEGANKVAQMAHNGLARTLRPAHTSLDGDTLFALSTGKKKAPASLIGAFAAEVTARAVVNAVRAAATIAGIPGLAKPLG